MGRFWLGVGLLVLFLVLGFWISAAMDQVHSDISEILQLAAQQALDGDMDAGMETARQAQAQWEKYWHSSAAVADHAPMDEIDGLLAQLECYSRSDQPGEFAACCTRISLLVRAMSEAHSLSWWNFL